MRSGAAPCAGLSQLPRDPRRLPCVVGPGGLQPLPQYVSRPLWSSVANGLQPREEFVDIQDAQQPGVGASDGTL